MDATSIPQAADFSTFIELLQWRGIHEPARLVLKSVSYYDTAFFGSLYAGAVAVPGYREQHARPARGRALDST
jgi:hypothetical protein